MSALLKLNTMENTKKIKYKDAEVTVHINKVINDSTYGELCYTGSKVFPIKYIKMSDLVEKINKINSIGLVMKFKELSCEHKSNDDIYIAPIDIISITIKYLKDERTNT